jgi:hypothetical protein
MRSRPHPKTLLFLPLTVFGFSVMLLGKPARPGAMLTGGFGESTCRQCHSSHPLNEGRPLGGRFEIEGIPDEYEAGMSYRLTLLIAHPGRSHWGFELSARSANQGDQAGRLIAVDSDTELKEKDGISYITHAGTGANTRIADRRRISFLWVAPDSTSGMILFNAAGNAADGNGEPGGDFIYTAGGFSRHAADASQIKEAAVDEVKTAADRRLRESPILLNLPVPVDLDKGSIEIHIQHRFFQSLEDSDPGNAFGIDSGANISVGLNYALTGNLSAGISRTREDQLISLTATQEIHTKSGSIWKMSLHGGVAGKRNFEEHYSPFFQLATALDYKAFRLNLTPTFVFNSRDESLAAQPGPEAVNPDQNNTFALGIGADIALHRRFSVTGEYVPRLAGFGGFFGKHSQLGGGVAIRTWGHVFTVLVSRSRNFSPERYGVDADFDGVSLGFNIYRRIR